MAQIEANNITIEYQIDGEGEPLLLIMGLGSQLSSWPPGIIEVLLDRGYQVIRFDNRDAGFSTEFDGRAPTPVDIVTSIMAGDEPNVPYRLADMADDTAALLDALGCESVHVVGVSMGGMIAQSLAIAYPAKVKTLTSIMSTTGDHSVGGIDADLLARLPELSTNSIDDAVEKSVAMWEAISGSTYDEAESRARAERDTARSFRPQGEARQTAAIFAGPDRTPELNKLTMPTLVIHGLEDPLVLPSGGEATAAAIPGAKLVTYPDMGHNLPKKYWKDIADNLVELTGI